MLTFLEVGFGGNLVQGFRAYAWRAVPSFPQIALWGPSLAFWPQPFAVLWFDLNTDSTQGESQYYNAYEKDIAVANIFFGSSSVFGLESSTYFEQFRTPHVKFNTLFLLRVWALSKDDLAGLYLKPWRTLWTLSWNQFYLCHGTCLLVHHQAFQGSFEPCCLI